MARSKSHLYVRRRWSCLTVTAVVLAASGCTPMMRHTTGGVAAGRTVDAAEKILLLPIPDGVEEDGPAAGSGQAVYNAVRDTLISRGRQILAGKKTELVGAFEEAATLGCRYVLRGTIPEWEDNATEWSGKPDVAALSLELLDATDRSIVASASHRVNSSSGQMFSRRPERFVPEIVDVTLASIFGWPASVAAPK